MPVLVTASSAWAQAEEPPDFPFRPPGTTLLHGGDGCVMVAEGDVAPGDVDWLRLLLPFDSELTLVDVDIVGATGESLLRVQTSDGRVLFSTRDNNNSTDGTCGTGPVSDPVGNRRDSAVSLGATVAGITVEFGVTGYPDFALTGAHSQTFSYEVWVHALGTFGCVEDADCEDDVDCTLDLCNADTGDCEYWPDNDFCNNGLFCDGVEVCDMVAGCQTGTAADCDDRIECTNDFCDEFTRSCSHQPQHRRCDDGIFCNGSEYCHPRAGCRSTAPPCPTACSESRGCPGSILPPPPQWSGTPVSTRK